MNKSRGLSLVLIGLLSASSANAASILFGRVGSTSYVADGQSLVNFLGADGNTVDYVDLNTTVISDFSSYSQVWVYDLVTGPNSSANQVTNYQNIANWYLGLANQNLIVDGRIISSAPGWTNANGMSSEAGWIQNYATQLDLRGGGLVLGTDHASPGQPSGVFVDGINQINALIGIDPFEGFFGTYPTSQALVDSASPLAISGLDPCRDDPSEPCINDNSTTSFAPAGTQPNGQVLTPVAYHGVVSNAFDNAAIASTIGSVTFGTCDDGSQPPCNTGTGVPVPGTIALMGLGIAGFGHYRRRKQAGDA